MTDNLERVLFYDASLRIEFWYEGNRRELKNFSTEDHYQAEKEHLINELQKAREIAE
jgi:hypothetical protein